MSQPIVSETASPDSMEVEEILPFERKPLTAADIILAKELLFDKYTLKDEYPYKDTVRSFNGTTYANAWPLSRTFSTMPTAGRYSRITRM